MKNTEWDDRFTENSNGKKYTCGYCDTVVSPNDKLTCKSIHFPHSELAAIYICPSCNKPTYLNDFRQIPAVKYGYTVEYLPDDISNLYTEARSCYSGEAFTATSLICRKILMNVAVSKGAQTNQSFAFYVNYLNQQGYIPPDGKGWVDEIRKQGNEATHEINSILGEDALEILDFTGMLLKFIFEMPGRMNERTKAKQN